MGKKNASNDRNGTSAVVVVAAILIVAAAAAGLYVLLKDDSRQETTIEGKMGVGTVLYYDPVIGAVSSTATSEITGELVGENGTHYFFEFGDGTDSYIIVQIHKGTGAVDSASKNNGTWTVEITDEENKKKRAEITIGQLEDYGNVISSISVALEGENLFSVGIRSSGHEMVEPSGYEQSEYYGKYQKYSLSTVMTFDVPTVGLHTIETAGYSKAMVVGSATDDKLIVLMEGEVKVDSFIYSDGDYSFREYKVVADLKEAVPEMQNDIPGIVDNGTKDITVAGNSVQAKEYSFSTVQDGITVSGKMQTSLDGGIVYLYEVEGTGTVTGGVVMSLTISVEYAEGNL